MEPPHPNLIPPVIFWINFCVECISALFPVWRIIFLIYASSNYAAETLRMQLFVLFGISKCCWWYCISYKQNGSSFWKEFFFLDNLTGRGAVFSIAHVGILLSANQGWYAMSCITDFLVNLSFAGNLRTMLKYYYWTPFTMRCYAAIRLLTPICFISLGVWYVLTFAPSTTRTVYIFYLVCGIQFYHDSFTKTCNQFTAANWGRTKAQDNSQTKNELTAIETLFVFLVELYSYTAPLQRLFEDQGDVQTRRTFVVSITSGILRIFFFLYIQWRLRKNFRAMLGDLFYLDNLCSRQVVIMVAYVGLTLEHVADERKSSQEWISTAIVVEILLLFTFLGHVRTMSSAHRWTETKLHLYQLMRLTAPLFYLGAAGTITLLGKVNEYGALLLYTTAGYHFQFDVYVKTCNITIPKPVAQIAPPHAPEGLNEADTEGGGEEASEKTEQVVALPTFTSLWGIAKRRFGTSALVSTKKHDDSPEVVTRPLSRAEFALLIFTEIMSSTYPALRLINRKPLSDPESRSDTMLTTLLLFSWFRFCVFFYISYRLRRGFLRKEYFTIDNLMGRVMCVELAFSFNTVAIFIVGWKCFLVIFSSVVMDWTLAGNVRLVLRHHRWTVGTLRLYRVQRLYALLVYGASGVHFMMTEPASSGYRKNLFVMFLIYGIVYFQDLLVRACVTTIEPVTKVVPALPSPRPEKATAEATAEEAAKEAAEEATAAIGENVVDPTATEEAAESKLEEHHP